MSPASFFRPDKWPRTPSQFLEAASSVPLTPSQWRDAADEMRRSPSRMFLDMVQSTARSLIGRDLEIRTGDSDVTVVLDDVTYAHDPPAIPWIPGTELEVVDEIDITVSEVRWEHGKIDRLHIGLRNVTLDPGVVATVYVRPVQLEAEVVQATLDEWLTSLGVDDVEIVLDGEGTAMAYPVQWKRWGVRALVEPELEEDAAVHLHVRRIWIGPFSFRRLRWVPQRHTIPLPTFDRDLTVTAVAVEPGVVRVRAEIPVWKEKVPLERALRAASTVSNHVIFDREPL